MFNGKDSMSIYRVGTLSLVESLMAKVQVQVLMGVMEGEQEGALPGSAGEWGRGLGREEGSWSSFVEPGRPLPAQAPRTLKRRFYI